MSKPTAFQNPFVALNNIPYVCSDDAGKERTASGGVLSRGQVVWLRDLQQTFRGAKSAMAFVEGIGIISVDPRWLVSGPAAPRSGQVLATPTRDTPTKDPIARFIVASGRTPRAADAPDALGD